MNPWVLYNRSLDVILCVKLFEAEESLWGVKAGIRHAIPDPVVDHTFGLPWELREHEVPSSGFPIEAELLSCLKIWAEGRKLT